MSTELVATVIAGSGSRLHPDILRKLAGDVNASRAEWVNKGVAGDLFCQGIISEIYARLNASLQNQTADVLIQPVATRRKKLLLADMESTVIEQEMLDEMAEAIGQRAQVADITRRAMNGELDFGDALRERVALFKGQPVALLKTMMEQITYMPGASELVTAMKAEGAECWLVTGGFSCFARPVAETLGFNKVFANELVIRDGVITGIVSEPILDRAAKKRLLGEACREMKTPLAEVLTVGDGANDVPMLTACNEGGGLGVAYQAKPKVRDLVPHQINHGDLTALLYAQGLQITP